MSLFITFEGVEGSGKTTQIKLLADFLVSQGHPVLLTREPGGTTVADQIRKILLDAQNSNMSPMCELLLYGASRAEHCEKVIRPALEKNKIVLCDRFFDATVAYQEGGRGLNPKAVQGVNEWAVQGLKPDLTVFLDCPVKLGLARAQRRMEGQAEKEDRFEREEELFHERVRTRYLKIAQEEKSRFIVVDAIGTIEEVHRRVIDQLKPFDKLKVSG